MSRPKKTEAEMQIRRDQILDTAYAILQKDGPHALTSRAIADRMGVAHMSLYTYFKNQAAILSALSEREMAKLHARQHAIEQRAETEDIVLVMLDALKLFITFACENPNLYRLAWVIPEGGGENLEQSRQRMQDTVWYLARLLKQGMEQGSFTTREPFLAAATVLGMINMPHILFHSGKLIDPELRDRMVVEVLSAAMGYLKD